MKLILIQHIRLFLLPLCQVAGEVLAKADDTPVLSIVDSSESISMGQVHLSTKKTKGHLYTLPSIYFIFLCQMNAD